MTQGSRIPEDYRNAILKHVGDKVGLMPADKDLFSFLLQCKSFSKGTQILRPGEICRNQSFVVKGCLRVFYLDTRGEEHIAKFATENWWAFDIESFFESTKAYYGISCLEPTIVLQLSQEAHRELLERIPAFERFYRLMLQHSFIALQHRMTQSLALTAEERYLRFQEKYPGLETRIPQKQIASYLGITPVFLSMIRKLQSVKH